jgi:hypothetical protein
VDQRTARRGARARNLAAEIELKFGKQPYTKAQYDSAWRWASTHDLVIKGDVRIVDRPKVLRTALQIYFAVTDEVMVDAAMLNCRQARKLNAFMANPTQA